MVLSDIKINNTAVVRELRCKDGIKRRLMDIGLTKGVKVSVKGKAPLGDPMLINLRGFNLAIRLSDAKYIIVE